MFIIAAVKKENQKERNRSEEHRIGRQKREDISVSGIFMKSRLLRAETWTMEKTWKQRKGTQHGMNSLYEKLTEGTSWETWYLMWWKVQMKMFRWGTLFWFSSHAVTNYHKLLTAFSSVQSLSCVQLFATPSTAAHQASLSITNSQSLLKLMSIELAMPSNHLILCHPLLLPTSIFPSIGVFSNESVLPIRWPKYWSFSFSLSPFQWIFRTSFL